MLPQWEGLRRKGGKPGPSPARKKEASHMIGRSVNKEEVSPTGNNGIIADDKIGDRIHHEDVSHSVSASSA